MTPGETHLAVGDQLDEAVLSLTRERARMHPEIYRQFLGHDWIEVEPGIYERRPEPAPPPLWPSRL